MAEPKPHGAAYLTTTNQEAEMPEQDTLIPLSTDAPAAVGDPFQPAAAEPNEDDTLDLYTETQTAEPTLNGKPVTVLRAATEADAGFIPGRKDAQLLVRHPDGELQVVFADKVEHPAVSK